MGEAETWNLWASFVEEDAPLDAAYEAWTVEGCAMADSDDEAGPFSQLIEAMCVRAILQREASDGQ